MTDKAKIREALEWYANRLSNLQDDINYDGFGKRAREALALLDAERPSVPMAMRDELGVWMQGGSAKANEILTHHGFDVKE